MGQLHNTTLKKQHSEVKITDGSGATTAPLFLAFSPFHPTKIIFAFAQGTEVQYLWVKKSLQGLVFSISPSFGYCGQNTGSNK